MLFMNVRTWWLSDAPIGVGLTAKAVDAGGVDLVIVYNSGRYRMNGLGSLAGMMPYGNANEIVLQMVCF